MAQTAINTATTATTTNHWLLDGEYRVHVVDSDGEYPPCHTEQSVRGARGKMVGRGVYAYVCVLDSKAETRYSKQHGARAYAQTYIGVQISTTVYI